MTTAPRRAALGLIQVPADYEASIEQCQQTLLDLTVECLEAGADLVVMPEGYQYKSTSLTPRECALQHAPGFAARCAELARNYRAHIAMWDYRLQGEQVRNAVTIIGPDGATVGVYDKVHLTHPELDKGISPGSTYPVFELAEPLGRVGVMICMDAFYPEPASILAQQRAELVLYPLYGDTLAARWELRTRTRAIDNSVVIAACQIHSSPEEPISSWTGVIAADGEVVERLPSRRGWSVVEVELGAPVVTWMNGVGDRAEDYAAYLRNLRAPHTYGQLLSGVERTPWDEVEFSARHPSAALTDARDDAK